MLGMTGIAYRPPYLQQKKENEIFNKNESLLNSIPIACEEIETQLENLPSDNIQISFLKTILDKLSGIAQQLGRIQNEYTELLPRDKKERKIFCQKHETHVINIEVQLTNLYELHKKICDCYLIHAKYKKD